MSDLKFRAPLNGADWTVSADERLQAVLSLALTKNVPGWPGATDEQLEAVAHDILAALDTNRVQDAR